MAFSKQELERMMSKKFDVLCWYWLLGVICGVILFGFAFIFLPNPMLNLFDWLLYPNSPAESPFNSPAVGYIIFAHRVLGAVMIGWGVSLLFTVVGLWRRGDGLAWYAVAVSVVAWFIPDTAFSWFSGFGGNAFLNILFFVAFAAPLLLTHKRFTKFPLKLTK